MIIHNQYLITIAIEKHPALKNEILGWVHIMSRNNFYNLQELKVVFGNIKLKYRFTLFPIPESRRKISAQICYASQSVIFGSIIKEAKLCLI